MSSQAYIPIIIISRCYVSARINYIDKPVCRHMDSLREHSSHFKRLVAFNIGANLHFWMSILEPRIDKEVAFRSLELSPRSSSERCRIYYALNPARDDVNRPTHMSASCLHYLIFSSSSSFKVILIIIISDRLSLSGLLRSASRRVQAAAARHAGQVLSDPHSPSTSGHVPRSPRASIAPSISAIREGRLPCIHWLTAAPLTPMLSAI